jgi:hypothetical protein
VDQWLGAAILGTERDRRLWLSGRSSSSHALVLGEQMTGFIVGEKINTVTFSKSKPPYRINKKGVVTKILPNGYEIKYGRKTREFITDHTLAPDHIGMGDVYYEGYFEE